MLFGILPVQVTFIMISQGIEFRQIVYFDRFNALIMDNCERSSLKFIFTAEIEK